MEPFQGKKKKKLHGILRWQGLPLLLILPPIKPIYGLFFISKKNQEELLYS